MRQLRDLLQEAQQNGVAVGHFNISDPVLLKAVFAAKSRLSSRVATVTLLQAAACGM